MRNFITLFSLLSFSWVLIAQQEYKQTIRGTIYDKDSKKPLPGANIVLLNSQPSIGTVSDDKGKFD